MGYIEEILSPDERVLYKAKFHWLYTLSAVLALILLTPLFGLGLVIFFYMMIRKWTTEIGITTQKVIYKRGWVARKTDEISMQKVEEINLDQSILGRILGYGTVRIQGTGVGELVLPPIDDPLEFRREIGKAKSVT
jgi:uncharacterized membrane protein YdbT with pleckstrin-like domain